MELSAEQRQQLQEQKKHCPFCRIIAGEIPAQKVYEDDKVLAILDINPLRKGHVLVMPKEHYPIMALMPEDEFNYMFGLIGQFTKYLKKTLLVNNVYTYIANGAAAGQQSGHFMIHLIPSEDRISQFHPPEKPLDQNGYDELSRVLSNNYPLMMRSRTQLFPLEQSLDTDERSRRLAELLEENPDFKTALMNDPETIRAGIAENPSLQELFEGVDLDALSEKLKDAESSVQTEESPTQEAEPEFVRAVDLSDSELRSFIDSKEKLKELLTQNIPVLKEAIQQQEKLQVFFAETSPEQVLARYQGEKLGLEDLAQ